MNMYKNFMVWHEVKSDIDAKESKTFFHEREVWWCSLGLNIGFEQDGKGNDFSRH